MDVNTDSDGDFEYEYGPETEVSIFGSALSSFPQLTSRY